MDEEVLVKVEGVSKKFCRDLKRSLWYGVKDIGAELIGVHKNGQLRSKEFWAVNDVSFELKRGECLGLIGHNGAGKSTLLKMLNGLIKPDKGTITMKGRIGALIELGSGFNPILTGRENIYNNGAVLGFSRKEIEKKFDAIVEFADIGDFIDTPVQNYSSGMKVRLGFAVAAQMEPDVLIIDEVLAVGDIGFRIKCFNKLSEILKNSAVILVSHNMPQIAKISSDMILMNKGILTFHSKNILEGIEKYFDQYKGEDSYKTGTAINVNEIFINGQNAFGKTINTLYNHELNLKMNFSIEEELEFIQLVVVFVDKNLRPLASCMSNVIKISEDQSSQNIKVRIPNLQFAIGKYSINLNFHKYEPNGNQMFILTKYNAITEISVSGSELVNPTSIHLIGEWN